eukprot:gnl/Dysnectes_brevis/6314_a9706_436.p1 GENE.gnl/Dysnectes_brevis/6314_a9706_436~~gnl/Dysnectes_brevis/6314_a9706_436.p1  ORF type:complete len:375 (+),score=145.64 gnl/Dysnectes_brevis/6314_a9706_436:88-1212(+)
MDFNSPHSHDYMSDMHSATNPAPPTDPAPPLPTEDLFHQAAPPDEPIYELPEVESTEPYPGDPSKPLRPPPSIEVLASTDEELSLKMTHLDISYINALRRVILADVPTLAVDRVTFVTNTSVFTEQMLAHRLGMVPITAKDAEEGGVTDINYWWECNCSGSEGCSQCTVRGTLEISNETTQPIPVTDFDIAISGFSTLSQGAENPSPPVLLAKLAPGQAIHADLLIRKGKGRVHAKWTPAVVRVKPKAVIRINPELMETFQGGTDEMVRFIRTCPRGVFEGPPGLRIDPSRCIFCDQCTQFRPRSPIQGRPCVAVPDMSEVIFEIESISALKPMQIFKLAFGELRRTLKWFHTACLDQQTGEDIDESESEDLLD